MKKNYMKPEVNEIEVSANQSVAACSLSAGYRCRGDYGAKHSSAQAAWTNASCVNGHGSFDWNPETQVTEFNMAPIAYTEESAFQTHFVFPVYDIAGTHDDGSGWSFRFEDFNSNGRYDAGEQQNNINDAETMGLVTNGMAYSSVVAS